MTRSDIWRNEEVRRRFCGREKMCARLDRKVLEGFGLVDRMKGERLNERVYETGVKLRKDRCRPFTVWLDTVKKSFVAKSLELNNLKVMYMVQMEIESKRYDRENLRPETLKVYTPMRYEMLLH